MISQIQKKGLVKMSDGFAEIEWNKMGSKHLHLMCGWNKWQEPKIEEPESLISWMFIWLAVSSPHKSFAAKQLWRN